MSAKEMFEELGYKLKYKNKYKIMYIKPDVFLNAVLPLDLYQYYKIIINRKDEIIEKYGSAITFEEIQAINKQVEELGWLNAN